jgi:capsular polysaccharide transport system permease protein
MITLSLATTRVISALMLREMSTMYGRSRGGYIWALAEPVLGIVLLSVIFSIGFRTPQLGTNFPMFYATGLIPFLTFNDVSTKVAQSINYSRQLLTYPCVTFIDAIIARFLLNFTTQLVIGFVVLFGITSVFETHTSMEAAPILLAIAMVSALALGVGTLNCFLLSYFPVWQRIYGIITRPLLLVSAVIFTLETVPQPYRDWLWFNPLVHVIGSLRAGFYNSYDAVYVSPIYVFSVSLGLILSGQLLLHRYHNDILEL